jgi:SagB-type dehydrogenase family enzyme
VTAPTAGGRLLLTGYPPVDVDSWRRIMRVCKAHGLNALRFHSWCPPEAAFIAGDEEGVYFQVECSSWANMGVGLGEGNPVDAWLYAEAERIIAANGNHPTDAITGATCKVFPSAGGLYPLEAFLVCGQNTVEGILAGVYKYNSADHSLSQLTSGDNRKLLAAAAFSQMFIAQAPAAVVIGAVFERMTVKYGPRGMNYVLMEAGMANQNIFLQAESLGLKVAAVGAFHDAQVAAALKLPAGVSPLLVVPVGK